MRPSDLVGISYARSVVRWHIEVVQPFGTGNQEALSLTTPIAETVAAERTMTLRVDRSLAAGRKCLLAAMTTFMFGGVPLVADDRPKPACEMTSSLSLGCICLMF